MEDSAEDDPAVDTAGMLCRFFLTDPGDDASVGEETSAGDRDWVVVPDIDERLLLDEDAFRLITSSSTVCEGASSIVLAVVVLAAVGTDDACELLLVVAVLDIECLFAALFHSRGGLPELLSTAAVDDICAEECDSSGTMPRRDISG